MLLLGIDVETTGLDTEKDRITEIGAVLWDSEAKKPLAMLSELCVFEDMPELSELIINLTGITQDMLDNYAVFPKELFIELFSLMRVADACVAHNAPFDKGMLESNAKSIDLELPDIPWIDTTVDVPYPDNIKTRKLTHLAAEHGFVNPFAHRAVFDVLTMLVVLSNYDAAEVLELSKSPSVILVANTKKPWLDQAPEGKKQSDLAKCLGFRWNGAKKTWEKQVKQAQAETVLTACKNLFPVRIVE